MKKYTKFLCSMGKIGCIGFGGGSALIPVIEDEIVKKQGLDTKENLDKDVIVASITPGALPVEIAASIGRRTFGSKGMVMGAVMMALPGALATVLLMTIFSMMQEKVLPVIEWISVGISAFIIYLLISYIRGMLRECKRDGKVRLQKAVALMIAIFVMVCGKNVYKLLGIEQTPILGLSTVQVLLLAFFCMFYCRSRYSIRNIVVMLLLGGIYLLGHGKAQVINCVWLTAAVDILMFLLAVWGIAQNMRESNWKFEHKGHLIQKDLTIWILVFVVCSIPAVVMEWEAIVYLGKGILSALMSFGGGDAYLTIADGLFVESGMVSETQYYSQIVSAVNILPGSILCKTLSAVGYYIGFNISGNIVPGVLFAIAGFSCSIAASCGFFMVIYHFYNNLLSLWAFRLISRWIRPIIAGLLINIMLSLLNQSLTVLSQLW